ncbi:hypothetical protein [Prochlorococcus sp. MIT 1303]|uniref:hypothetical protein n=1 Tax=Prochlorococcus sp. MIT 1303 TaxID=1723647 RepID=UPI0012E7A84F|nr:hypothetical protein [Prochlorococcus sp. MIT 1303]
MSNVFRECQIFILSRQSYAEEGFWYSKGLIDLEMVNHMLQFTRSISGLDDSDSDLVSNGLKQGFLSPCFLVKEPSIWPFLSYPKLISTIRDLIGPSIRFCHGGDILFAHRSGFPFHRDLWFDFSEPPSWDSGLKNFKFVRAITFFHEYRPITFGLYPGSHLVNSCSRKAIWIDVNPGDVVFFDPRLLHSGLACDFPKYGSILTFAVENKHSYDYHFYRRFVQIPDRYTSPSKSFIDFLSKLSLYSPSIMDLALQNFYRKQLAHISPAEPPQGYLSTHFNNRTACT